MTPQDWESPAMFAVPTGMPAQEGSELAAAYAMRPLSTGEVLDRTFSIYRSCFWLFAGIASLSAAVQLFANAIVMLVAHFVRLKYGASTGFGARAIGAYPVALTFFLVSSVTQAATIYALAEVYMGRTATVPESLRATVGRWYRYIGIALWQSWSAIWVGTLLGIPAVVITIMKVRGLLWLQVSLFLLAVFVGFSYGIIAYLRNALGVQASVIEHLTVRAAMRRSKTLASGALGRIFVVLLIAGVLLWVAGIAQAPLGFLLIRSPNKEHVVAEAIILLVNFVANTLVPPVALIGLSLVYFDQRVRKEAFDLVMLLGGETPAPVAMAETAEAPTVVAAVSDLGGYSAETSGDPAEPIGNDGQV